MIQSEKSSLNSPQRLQALQATRLMDTPPEEAFDQLTRLACRLLQVPVAFISLVDSQHQFFKSSQGLGEPWATQRSTPLSHSFCQHVVTSQAPLVIADARKEPLVCQNPAIAEMQIVAYLGVPLNTATGATIGALCAVDHHPRTWSQAEIDTLSELAQLTMEIISMRQHLYEQSTLEKAWHQRVETYRTLFEQAGVGKAEIDLQTGTVVRVNQKLRAITGYRAEALQALGAFALVHAQVSQQNGQATARGDTAAWQALVTGQADTYTLEQQWPSRDGVTKLLHITVTRIRDESDERRALAIFQDVTDNREAEQALRASEANFRTLFESMTQGVMYQDAEGRITAANSAAEEILGLTLDEMQGRQSVDPRWRATRMDGSDFPGEEHPAMMALRTGEVQQGILMYIFNPRKQEKRCLRVDSVPQFHLGETRPYQVYTLFQDITEQRRADEELAFHAQLLAHMHDAVVATDTQLNITAWNSGAEQMYGWSANEAIGRQVREVIRSELDENLRQTALQELKTFGHYRMELLTHHRDGTPIATEGVTVALHDKQGHTIGYLSINRDITERKRSEAALKESSEQLQMITDNVPGLIAYIDREERYRFVNATYESWYGVPREQILGQKISNFVRPTTYAMAQPHIAKVLAGQPTTFEVETTRNDKPVTWLMRYTPRLTTDQQVLGFYTLTTDITERKRIETALVEREERFRATFEQTAVGIAHYNLAGGYIRVNHCLCEILGYSRSELLQKDFQSITHPDDLADSQARFEQLLAGACENYSIAKRYLRKDGTYLWVNITVSLVRNVQTQAPDYCISVIQDISERKRYEQELQELNDTLERRVANRTQQLQTSNAKLLDSQAKFRQLNQQLMQMLEKERTRISREIHDQLGQGLTAIKMEMKAGQRRLDPSQTVVIERLKSAEGLIDETIQTVRRIAADLRPGILDDFGLGAAVEWQMQQFQTRYGLACHCQLQLDETKLTSEMATAAYRILQEALTNILRHAQASQVSVNLELINEEFRLSIHDNGRGMAGIDHERPSLGVMGMRERAEQVGGTLELISAPGEGTTVLLRMPCSDSAK